MEKKSNCEWNEADDEEEKKIQNNDKYTKLNTNEWINKIKINITSWVCVVDVVECARTSCQDPEEIWKECMVKSLRSNRFHQFFFSIQSVVNLYWSSANCNIESANVSASVAFDFQFFRPHFYHKFNFWFMTNSRTANISIYCVLLSVIEPNWSSKW